MARTPTTPHQLPQIKPHALRGFYQALAKWYVENGRHDLPWRTTRDPYAIWVSEVMLQQTQVATVLARFYHPFLEKFPTVQALASASREEVMKAWEGLGYYRRAGYLHEAAKKVANRNILGVGTAVPHGSPLPQGGRGCEHEKSIRPDRFFQSQGEGAVKSVHNFESPSPNLSPLGGEGYAGSPSLATLLALPGIGRNTAHAILAFAYHQPVAILEANVKRVVARIFALEHPSEQQLWSGAESLLNKREAFDYNQAMMDLGSMLCTPKAPRCGACPAQHICAGKSSPESYPAPKQKKKIPTRSVVILVQHDAADRYYLERRDEALLGGLWGFPQEAVIASEARQSSKKNAAAKTHRAGLPRFARNDGAYIGTVTHIYSHFRLEGTVYLQQRTEKNLGNSWFTREEITALPLSKLDHKVLALLDTRHTAPPNATDARKTLVRA